MRFLVDDILHIDDPTACITHPMTDKISGMFKQDYIVRRVLNEEIEVYPNIRLQRCIIDCLSELTTELKRLERIDQDSYVLDNIKYLLDVTQKLSLQ